MTYAELIAKIQVWWESDETAFLAQFDNFIENAELRIYRTVDLNVARKEDQTIAITEAINSVTLPADLIILRSVSYQNGTVRSLLLQKDESFLLDYAPDYSVEGIPKYYSWANSDSLIWLAPTPNALAATGTIRLSYTYRPTQLSSGNTTTWLSLNAPDVLFYACMLEVLTFQKAEPDTIADYAAKYQQTLQGFIMEQNLRNRSDEYRSGEIKVGGAQ
jgi:hypothetical protein